MLAKCITLSLLRGRVLTLTPGELFKPKGIGSDRTLDCATSLPLKACTDESSFYAFEAEGLLSFRASITTIDSSSVSLSSLRMRSTLSWCSSV